MKIIYILVAYAMAICNATGQILLEDRDGDQIAGSAQMTNAAGVATNLPTIKLNTSNQALGFSFFRSTNSINPAKYSLQQFGIEAKPTEGYASVLSDGKFSPGVRLTYSYTKYPIINNWNFPNWGGFLVNYDVNNYSLFRVDTVFKNQVYNKSFTGLSFYLHYNFLIGSRYIVNIRTGYSRRSNADDLRTIEVRDITRIVDASTSIEREIIKTKNAKEGNFEERDTFPFTLAFTRATKTDTAGSADEKRLRIGYTLFFKNIFASGHLPKTSFGGIVFLTKQDLNSGVRNPVFGINVQLIDPFDVEKVNNGLEKRIKVGFTTIFAL